MRYVVDQNVVTWCMTVQAELSIKWHCNIYDTKENAWHYMMVGSFLNRLLSFVVLMLTENCESILFVL